MIDVYCKSDEYTSGIAEVKIPVSCPDFEGDIYGVINRVALAEQRILLGQASKLSARHAIIWSD